MINNGSEWRKWDLHVHTPASIVHDYAKGSYEEVWDRYFYELENLPSDIKVLGINDYWFLDGYKKVKEYKESGRLNNIDLILPVIEFRLRDFVGSSQLNKINYHIIFSDKLTVEEIEEEFLRRFEITEYENRSLTRENLIAFGNKFREETPTAMQGTLPSSNLQVGFNNFTISLARIEELLKKDLFKDKYIRVIGQTEWNDFRWDGSPSDKRALINGCDFVFSASSTIDNILRSKESLTQQEVNDSLLHCSDAHQFYGTEYTSKILGHCYTWIKSDTSFEGLKQVIYESKRVSLSETNPSQKNSYQYIKEIKLMDNGELFGEQTIGLNKDLNSIIGGKSSGKSLLLYHIAKSVMNHEKFQTITSTDGFQKYDDLPVFELEVTWGDGSISKLSDYDNKRPIVYIPQMYLNYMAEKKSRNEDFKQTIDGILKTNNGYGDFLSTKQSQILGLEQRIDNGIRNYFQQLEILHDLKRELIQLGDRTAIAINVSIIEHQLDTLKKTAGFTQPELDRYSGLNESNKTLLERKNILVSIKKLYDDLQENTIQLDAKISSFVKDEFSDLKYKYQNEELQAIIEYTISSLSTAISSGIGSYMSSAPFEQRTIEEEIISIEEEIIKNNKLIKPLNEKAKNLESLKEQEKSLDIEKAKILAIDLKLSEIQTQQRRIDIDIIIDLYSNLLNSYKDIVDKHEEYKHISDSIDLLSEISFSEDNFRRDFSEYITKNRTLEAMFEGHGFLGNQFSYSDENHIENIRYICNVILSDGEPFISFNQGKQKQEIISALFKNYFDISYDLMQGTDRLAHMSPGKKGIILFQLFLHMSSSQDPILIDQPEDNLDNRTVYQELNDFIKEKKLQRQIIIVSHNSNLVVSTDSENVIVAHQNSNSGDRPKFEYINGSLENTFIDSSANHILQKQGIREHVCEILEGGVEAFKKREKKYNI